MKVGNSVPAALDVEEVRQQLEQFRSCGSPKF